MAHIKISRKNLKEDGLRTFGTEAYDHIRTNQKKILIVLAALCVVLLGWKIYKIQKQSVLREANLLFSQAVNSFQNALYSESSEDQNNNLNMCMENAKRIASDYGSSPIANEAFYLQASAQFFKATSPEDYDQAIRLFNEYIERVRSDNEKALGYISLGYSYENKYFLTDDLQILPLAIKAYESGIDYGKDAASGAEAKLCKARLLELQYKDDQAKILYESVKEQRKAKPLVSQAKEVDFKDPQLNFMYTQLNTMKNLFTFSQNAQFGLERIEGQK